MLLLFSENYLFSSQSSPQSMSNWSNSQKPWRVFHKKKVRIALYWPSIMNPFHTILYTECFHFCCENRFDQLESEMKLARFLNFRRVPIRQVQREKTPGISSRISSTSRPITGRTLQPSPATESKSCPGRYNKLLFSMQLI